MADGVFDYIIVGAGTAGCILAARLSENPKNRVALIEAGGTDRSFVFRVPMGFIRTYYDPCCNFMYWSAPQAGLDGRTIYCPRGKVQGGSGSINAMIYVRGAPDDFDSWAEAGNTGWSYADVLPVFRRIESHWAGDTATHGASGPIGVSSMRDAVHPLFDAFLAGARELGFAENLDFNGESFAGAGIYDVNIRRGRRSSSSVEYLWPALRRRNLRLFCNTTARRIVTDEEGAVSGLEIECRGRRQTLALSGEMILAAGAVDTPKLLQLSGIGDGARSQALSLPVMRHLPAVGKYLQDHLHVSFCFAANRRTLNDEVLGLFGRGRTAWRYLWGRKGLMAMSVNQAGGFFAWPPDGRAAGFQLYFNPLSYRVPQDGSRRLLPDPYSGFLIGVNACRPESRGSVEILTPDPARAPAIDPNYLAAERDVADAVRGARLVRAFAATRAIEAVSDREVLPGKEIEDEAALLAYFRANAASIYHLCGTARMGTDPETSVVDRRLRVHGVRRLRIADASVFPLITSGNIQAPVMMVAEKCADMIAEDGR